jgi:hypothetical protein
MPRHFDISCLIFCVARTHLDMTSNGSSDLPPQSARPRDGPATSFEVDPVMTEILSLKNGDDSDDFGLVFVVGHGWPQNTNELEEPYSALVKAMCSCFDPDDHDTCAYFYPLASLHVTVATLHAFTLKTRNPDERAVLESEWRSVMLLPSRDPNSLNNH